MFAVSLMPQVLPTPTIYIYIFFFVSSGDGVSRASPSPRLLKNIVCVFCTMRVW